MYDPFAFVFAAGSSTALMHGTKSGYVCDISGGGFVFAEVRVVRRPTQAERGRESEERGLIEKVCNEGMRVW